MSYFVKNIETDVMSRAMLDNPIWSALLATGCVQFGDIGRFVSQGGEYVTIPRRNRVAALSHIDITNPSALTFTSMSTTSDKAVVVHDASANKYKKHDVILSGDNIGGAIAADYGERVAQRMLEQTCNVLTGSIQAIDSPSANCHVKDLGNAPITAQALRQSINLMADKTDSLRVAIMHSKVWTDLQRDLSVTYNSLDAVAGGMVITGKIPAVFGLDMFVVTNYCYNSNVGTGSSGDDRYHTYILGNNGPVQAGWQLAPEVELQIDITQPSTEYLAKITADYCVHLSGLAWNSTANPADSSLRNASLYTAAYEDHREVPAVLLVSNGGVYA